MSGVCNCYHKHAVCRYSAWKVSSLGTRLAQEQVCLNPSDEAGQAVRLDQLWAGGHICLEVSVNACWEDNLISKVHHWPQHVHLRQQKHLCCSLLNLNLYTSSTSAGLLNLSRALLDTKIPNSPSPKGCLWTAC